VACGEFYSKLRPFSGNESLEKSICAAGLAMAVTTPDPNAANPIEMIVAPMTLGERRRHEHAALDQLEVRRFARHSTIVAQRRIV
jgi:hypothetical protein